MLPHPVNVAFTKLRQMRRKLERCRALSRGGRGTFRVICRFRSKQSPSQRRMQCTDAVFLSPSSERPPAAWRSPPRPQRRRRRPGRRFSHLRRKLLLKTCPRRAPRRRSDVTRAGIGAITGATGVMAAGIFAGAGCAGRITGPAAAGAAAFAGWFRTGGASWSAAAGGVRNRQVALAKRGLWPRFSFGGPSVLDLRQPRQRRYRNRGKPLWPERWTSQSRWIVMIGIFHSSTAPLRRRQASVIVHCRSASQISCATGPIVMGR